MKHILPLEFEPPFKSFSVYANKQGIMLAQSEDAKCWIMSHYLGLMWNKIFIIEDSAVSFFDYGPLEISCYDTNAEILMSRPREFKETVKGFIRDGYYLWGYFNEISIPASRVYKKNDNCHDCFIYGFSDEGELYSIGYTKVWRYEPYRFTFEEYIDSLIKFRSNDIRIMLMKPTEGFEYRTDWNNIRRSIENFLNSADISRSPETKYSFGLRAQEAYLDYLGNEDGVSPNILLKNSRMLMEYKALIHDVLREHPKYGMIREMTEYCGLYDIYRLQHILSLKYTVKSDKDIIWTIKSHLKDAFKREYVVLEKLLECWGQL